VSEEEKEDRQEIKDQAQLLPPVVDVAGRCCPLVVLGSPPAHHITWAVEL
jgi:hypothetical protein